MLIQSPRKVLAVPIDNSATSYHRVIQPLYELMQTGKPWSENIQFLGPQDEQLAQYEWADILYIQCLYTPGASEFYAEQKKKGKRIILDFDDDYINIPEDSPEQTEVIDAKTGETYSFPPQMRSLFVQMFVQLADIVVVTTNRLKELYSPWAKNIKVIPNCVSEDMRRDIPKTTNDKVRILWSGSSSHLPDLELIRNPLKRLVDELGDKVELHFQGPLEFKQVFPELPIVEHGSVEFGDYLNKIQEINPDIALAPLKENAFNAAKSNLKYSQMTLMEAAVVASSFGPYSNIDHKYDGMLAKNEKGWFNSIRELVEDKELREKLVKNATSFVNNNHMIQKHLPRWRQLLVS